MVGSDVPWTGKNLKENQYIKKSFHDAYISKILIIIDVSNRLVVFTNPTIERHC